MLDKASDNLPTLLKKGSLEIKKGLPFEEVEKLKNKTPIKAITDFIRDRMVPPLKVLSKKLGDRVAMINGQTGCGKSTVLAPHIYNDLGGTYGVLLVQPRVITVMSLVQDMLRLYPHLKLGRNLGFQTGLTKHRSVHAGVTLVTTGIFTQYILNMEPDYFARRFSVVIVDEVHERDMNIDMSLLLVKRFLADYWNKPKCPFFILTSATIDMNKFGPYFDVPDNNRINVFGRAFPIVDTFAPEASSTDKYVLKTIIDIHETEPVSEKGDIIVFYKSVQGMNITEMIGSLQKYNSSLIKQSKNNVILPIKLSSEIFRNSDTYFYELNTPLKNLRIKIGDLEYQPTRRAIFTTPVAEVSLTIPSVTYCIDSGFVLRPEFVPTIGMNAVITKAVSRDMAMQRRGRVGRLHPGKWYPSYTKQSFGEMDYMQLPRIFTEDISSSILQLIGRQTAELGKSAKQLYGKALTPTTHVESQIHYNFDSFTYYIGQKAITIQRTQFDPKLYDFIDTPSSQSLIYCMEHLLQLEFIDSDGRLTFAGYMASKFTKIKCSSLRLIFNGFIYDANVEELVTVVAFIEAGWNTIFKRGYKMMDRAVLYEDQVLEAIMIFEDLMKSVEHNPVTTSRLTDKGKGFDLTEWCADHLLKPRGVVSALEIRRELIATMKLESMDITYGKHLDRNTLPNFKKCLAKAYEYNIAKWNGAKKTYVLSYRQIPLRIMSPLTDKKPKTIIIPTVVYAQLTPTLPPKYGFLNSSGISVLEPAEKKIQEDILTKEIEDLKSST